VVDFDARLKQAREIPEPLVELFRRIPASVHPMDVLRTAVSVLAHFDPDGDAPAADHAASVRKAERLIAQMATAVAYRERIVRGRG
jgi:citrate synthase